MRAKGQSLQPTGERVGKTSNTAHAAPARGFPRGLLALQQAAGNRAMTRLLAAASTVQRKVVIESVDAKRPLAPTGKAANDLWRNHVRFGLLDAKISPHGIKGGQFQKYLTRDDLVTAKTPAAFTNGLSRTCRPG
jgi:hypothetical protein